MDDIESLRILVVRMLADILDKMGDMDNRIRQLESRTHTLPLGYSRLQIAELMTTHFDTIELDMIAFDMNIEIDEIPGIARSEKVRSLIAYCERRLKMHELIFHCQRLRPSVSWPNAPH